jgi:CheY-like chemotaxis protein
MGLQGVVWADPRGNPMKFEETSANRADAAYCSQQACLAQDTSLKKFWDDLADDWLALDSVKEAVVEPKKPARERKRRVVIIEDDPVNADLLTSLVGKLGHDVEVKSDSSASHTYEIRDDDIVFVDMLMPKVSGIQVLEQLGRQNVKSAIVLMSGNDRLLNEAEQLVRKLSLDLLGVLYKPFQLPDVQSVLEAA